MHPIPIWCVLVALATACASTQPTLPAHTAADSAGVRTWTFAHPVADLLTDTTDQQIVVRMQDGSGGYRWQWVDGTTGETGWSLRYSESRHRSWTRYGDKLYRMDSNNPMLLDLRTRERLVAPKLMQTLYDPVHNLFVGFEEGLVTNGVVAYDADTGERKWSSRYFSTNLTPLIRLDPETWVFMTSKMHVLDPRDGSGWRKDVDLPIRSSIRVDVPASVAMSVVDTAFLLATGTITMGVSLWVMFEFESTLNLPYARLDSLFYMVADDAIQAVRLEDGGLVGRIGIPPLDGMPASMQVAEGAVWVVVGPKADDSPTPPYVARYHADLSDSVWHRNMEGLQDYRLQADSIVVLTTASLLVLDASSGDIRDEIPLPDPRDSGYLRFRSDIRPKAGAHLWTIETGAGDLMIVDTRTRESRIMTSGEGWVPDTDFAGVYTDGSDWMVENGPGGAPLVVVKADSYHRSADHHWFVYGNRVVSYPTCTGGRTRTDTPCGTRF